MNCLFSRSPHLQSGRLHLFKKTPTQWWVEPERKWLWDPVGRRRAPFSLAHPEVLH